VSCMADGEGSPADPASARAFLRGLSEASRRRIVTRAHAVLAAMLTAPAPAHTTPGSAALMAPRHPQPVPSKLEPPPLPPAAELPTASIAPSNGSHTNPYTSFLEPGPRVRVASADCVPRRASAVAEAATAEPAIPDMYTAFADSGAKCRDADSSSGPCAAVAAAASLDAEAAESPGSRAVGTAASAAADAASALKGAAASAAARAAFAARAVPPLFSDDQPADRRGRRHSVDVARAPASRRISSSALPVAPHVAARDRMASAEALQPWQAPPAGSGADNPAADAAAVKTESTTSRRRRASPDGGARAACYLSRSVSPPRVLKGPASHPLQTVSELEPTAFTAAAAAAAALRPAQSDALAACSVGSASAPALTAMG